MFYYLWRLAQPDAHQLKQSPRTFLRVRHPFLALASIQGLALYLNYARLVRR